MSITLYIKVFALFRKIVGIFLNYQVRGHTSQCVQLVKVISLCTYKQDVSFSKLSRLFFENFLEHKNSNNNAPKERNDFVMA